MSVMAYTRTPFDSRPTHDAERIRSSWDNAPRPYYPQIVSPPTMPVAPSSLMEPESESSDVSDNPGDDPQNRIHSSHPTPLPPPPSKHILESSEAIQARLRELQKVEDLNIKKQDQLKAKRARKDEKIRRKREAQDLKIKAIMDARARRDDRISRRRKMEDDAFERFDQDLEEEENSLRRRAKRLKRGLPVDDLMLSGNRVASASISPPAPAYSSIPPPAKRHQTGPPGQTGSPVTNTTPRPASHGIPSAPNSAGPNAPPPYAFLQSSHPQTSMSYGRSPTVSHSPLSVGSSHPPHPSHQPIPRAPQSQPAAETNPYSMNGHSGSPHLSRPSIPPPMAPHSAAPLNTAPPPRQSYDTRPPPPASSGFAPINPPPATSGFAAINPRNAATPPVPSRDIHMTKPLEQERVNGHARPYAPEPTPAVASTTTSSKRTPSTTHPYQMSEAFANRHHHCERVDQLNRGIWTSYGPGGTKEIPTGPPQEMYLRCNHDGCRRIDWRTVHGLQCHIVKNHEQPKGTIGSLEKALDRYGVLVAEIEAYERDHGPGSGGTMADPKNLKMKTRPARESTEKIDGRRSYGTQPSTAAYRTTLAMSFDSPQTYQGSPASVRSLGHEDSENSETEAKKGLIGNVPKPNEPAGRFAAINGGWSTTPTSNPSDPRDHEMRDAPSAPYPSGVANHSKPEEGSWKRWPHDVQPENRPEPAFRAVTSGPGSVPPSGLPFPATSHFIGEQPVRSGFVPLVPASNTASPNAQVQRTPPMVSQEAKFERRPEAGGLPDGTSQAQAVNETRNVPVTPSRDDPTAETGGKEPVRASLHHGGLLQQTTPPPVQDAARGLETLKQDSIEPSRAEIKSPEPPSTRRSSIAVRRRASYRRSSVVNNRGEEEREREQEETSRAEADVASTATEKERQDREREKEQSEAVPAPAPAPASIPATAPGTNATINPNTAINGEVQETDLKQERGEDQVRTTTSEQDASAIEDRGKDEDSDDGDTITAAVPLKEKENVGIGIKDKERDREAKERERDAKITPRRANGRFQRKATRQ